MAVILAGLSVSMAALGVYVVVLGEHLDANCREGDGDSDLREGSAKNVRAPPLLFLPFPAESEFEVLRWTA